MIQGYFLPELRKKGILTQHIWFQQDLATPHTSARTTDLMQEHFGERLISKGVWPARSPDIAPPDFYLFGYLKHKVYGEQPQTLDELEDCIRRHVHQIPRATLRAVFQNMHRRVIACKKARGGHFQHLPLPSVGLFLQTDLHSEIQQ